MRTIICVFAALCSINVSIVTGQIISSKTCAESGWIPMKNFRKASHMGLWYIQEMITLPPVANADCYTTGSKTAVATDVFHILDIKQEGRFFGTLYYGQPGIGSYTYTDGTFQQTITILSTDYYNYTVECACSDLGDHSESICYANTRSRTVSPAIQKKIDKIFADNNIDTTKMRKFKQDIKTCVFGLSKGLGGLLQGVLSLILG